MSDELLTTRQVSELLKVSVDTLARWRRDGTGPQHLAAGRQMRYRRSTVEAWIEQAETAAQAVAGF